MKLMLLTELKNRRIPAISDQGGIGRNDGSKRWPMQQAMNNEEIPDKLHHLIPLVEKWGISDDGYRDEAVEKATDLELEVLVEGITKEDAKELNRWFTDPRALSMLTDEYINYSAFFMAYEYAKVVLKSRMEKGSD